MTKQQNMKKDNSNTQEVSENRKKYLRKIK